MIKCKKGNLEIRGNAYEVLAELICIIDKLEKNDFLHVKDVIDDYYNNKFGKELN